MPTSTSRITQGIYCAEWVGNVTIEEIFDARDGLEALALEDGIEKFVTFIDATQIKSIPLDLRMMTKTINEGTIAILGLNAPYVGELVGRMINSITLDVKVEFFRDRDELLQRAHARLQDHNS